MGVLERKSALICGSVRTPRMPGFGVPLSGGQVAINLDMGERRGPQAVYSQGCGAPPPGAGGGAPSPLPRMLGEGTSTLWRHFPREAEQVPGMSPPVHPRWKGRLSLY